MTIGECHKCGEQVQEATNWDVSLSLGFTCENCNKRVFQTMQEGAKWLKENNRQVSKQINNN